MKARAIIFGLFAAVSFVALAPSGARSQNMYFYSDRSKSRAWLGVQVEDVSGRMSEDKKLSVKSGAYVGGVEDDSPADKAGIKEGDVIVKLNGSTIEDSDDLIRSLERVKPKSEAT